VCACPCAQSVCACVFCTCVCARAGRSAVASSPCVTFLCFGLCQTVHGGSLSFSDTNLDNFGSVVVRGSSAELVLNHYYSSSSYSYNNQNSLEFFANSSLSLEQNATLRNNARGRSSSEDGYIRFHGDVLSVDGSTIDLINTWGNTFFVGVSAFPAFSSVRITAGGVDVTSDGSSLAYAGPVWLAGGQFTTSADFVFSGPYEQTSDSSYLRGSGDVEISGSMLWTRGRMSGSGTTTITGTLRLEAPSSSLYVYLQDTRALVNNGAFFICVLTAHVLFCLLRFLRLVSVTLWLRSSRSLCLSFV
jgi:hypothetical protein